MDVIWQFILDNWQWLLTIVLAFIEFVIILIFRGKRKISYNLRDNILNRCYEILPDLINEAEEKYPGQGSKKLQYVLINCIKRFNSIGDLVYDKDVLAIITEYVEKILTTPTKKGD